jgi:hypothetical protein
MGQFLTGDVKTWFMAHVAPDLSKWTVEEIGKALFDTFLPLRIRSQLCKDFKTARQGEKNFKLFVQHVKNLVI